MAPQFLFVQKSRTCTFQEGDAGSVRLVFDALSPITTAFSDRPFRKDSVMTTKDFMGVYFDAAFAGDLPNAAILMEKDGEEQGPIVAKVKATEVDGKPAYALTQSPEQAAEGASLTALVGISYDLCVLFIDSAVYSLKS